MRTVFTKLLLSFGLIACMMTTTFAQDEEWAREESRWYFSSGGEMIFSWSDTDHPTSSDGVVVRWSPVFNVHGHINYDFGRAFGINAGLSMRNVGYIYQFNDVAGQSFRKKFRTYNLGIPVGVKIGNVDGFHVFGGYEVEFPFHYKEKTFDDDGDRINRIKSWFSDRVEPVQQSFFVGIQFREGTFIKFKYYFTEFHNQSFSQTTVDPWPPIADGGNMPYNGLTSNIFYVSVGSMISKKNYQYYKPPVRKRRDR